MMSTESELKQWRYGQVQAERMVAGLLHIEGYKQIDPQLPLGGPDGKKDILFVNEAKKWIAAAHFPTTEVSFSQVRSKFASDLAGVKANDAHGIAFFVNQHLSPTERAILLDDALPQKAEIFHVERMRGMLDSPSGCGLRLQYLRIAMTEEEQWSFWQAMNSRVMETLVENDQHLRRLNDKIDILLRRTESSEFGAVEPNSSLEQPEAVHVSLGQTALLTVEMLLWLHRLVTESGSIPEALRGKLRSIQVWITGDGATTGDGRYIPPHPEEIPTRLDKLLADWRTTYPSILNATRDRVLLELARFHHALLSLHPFADANGRVARVVIDQAAHELLGMRIGADFPDRTAVYYKALESADRGDLQPLVLVLEASLSR